MADFYIKRGDTSPGLEAALFDDPDEGVREDLHGVSVTFIMRPQNANNPKIEKPALVEDPAEGVVRYVWDAEDTEVVGEYYAEFEVERTDGSIESFPNVGYFTVKVADDLD